MHIIYLQGDTVQGTGSNISNSHVAQAIISLNRKFAGYDITVRGAEETVHPFT
ncbi:MAG: hypothetical protein M0R38_01525 [Bacteroidia bacterium]|nr:hypothetical protein [Bacteroidia bacterium]